MHISFAMRRSHVLHSTWTPKRTQRKVASRTRAVDWRESYKDTAMIRLAHLSDVHISATALGWRRRDWFSKRFTSWVNLRWFGRQQRFARADEVLGRLMDELPERNVDHIVFSGDATALGFESEFRRAAEILRVETEPIPGMAVPGNHDYITPGTAGSGLFERYFAPWQTGIRIGSHRYPFAQRAGPVWLVGVNAAVGNWMPWDARGHVGAAQRERLRLLLSQLDGAPRFLIIHYPIRLSTGVSETPLHGLRDLLEVLAIARSGGVSLWLHGHRHQPYYFDQPDWAPFPAICAGSGTEWGIWSYNEYTVGRDRVHAVRRAFDPKAHRFQDAQMFDVPLVCV
jgi:3',5'-cyclic AMP phosphodiesterase CpdA